MKVQLVLGDCLKRMPDIEEGTVTLVLCDPPYDLTSVSRGGSPRVPADTPTGRTMVGTDRSSKKTGIKERKPSHHAQVVGKPPLLLCDTQDRGFGGSRESSLGRSLEISGRA